VDAERPRRPSQRTGLANKQSSLTVSQRGGGAAGACEEPARAGVNHPEGAMERPCCLQVAGEGAPYGVYELGGGSRAREIHRTGAARRAAAQEIENVERRSLALALGLVLGIPAGAPDAFAAEPAERKITEVAELIDGANLVFAGSVARVEYRTAEVAGVEGALPYALVTYRVQDVLAGKAPGREFTMTFLGGPDGMGGFVEVSGVPVFQPGEEDVLFVRDDGETGCPLVDCEDGRFRVLKERVYNTHGSPVIEFAKGGRAVSGGASPEEFRRFRFPAPPFEGLLKRPEIAVMLRAQGMSIESARAMYAAQAPKEIELLTFNTETDGDGDAQAGGAPLPVKLRLPDIDRKTFLSGVVELARQKPREFAPLRGADPRRGLVLKGGVSAPAPQLDGEPLPLPGVPALPAPEIDPARPQGQDK
jgi:hypothetical protein